MVTTEKNNNNGEIKEVEPGHVGIPLTGFKFWDGESWQEDSTLSIKKG